MIYLDNAATSWPKPPGVAEAMLRQLAEDGNPGRGGHRRAVSAQRLIDHARLLLARLLNAPDPRRIIFTLNGTDALNAAIHGVPALQPGFRKTDSGKPAHVVTTVLEHNSVNRPLNALADAGAIELTRISCNADGILTPDDFAAEIRPNTALVAVTMLSNATGIVQPVAEIIRLTRAAAPNCLILLDASQALGAVPIDLVELDADLVAAPGHKSLLGPTGTGLLYLGPRAVPDPDHADRSRFATWREGGTGGDSSSPVMPAELPHYLEGGTPNTVGIAGLAAAVEWLIDRGVHNVRTHEQGLTRCLLEGLSALPGIRIIGPADADLRGNAVSFTLPDMDPQDAAGIFDSTFNIAVRPGLHCAPYAHRAVGTFPSGTIRASVGPFTTADEIDRFVAACRELTPSAIA